MPTDPRSIRRRVPRSWHPRPVSPVHGFRSRSTEPQKLPVPVPDTEWSVHKDYAWWRSVWYPAPPHRYPPSPHQGCECIWGSAAYIPERTCPLPPVPVLTVRIFHTGHRHRLRLLPSHTADICRPAQKRSPNLSRSPAALPSDGKQVLCGLPRT